MHVNKKINTSYFYGAKQKFQRKNRERPRNKDQEIHHTERKKKTQSIHKKKIKPNIYALLKSDDRETKQNYNH